MCIIYMDILAHVSIIVNAYSFVSEKKTGEQGRQWLLAAMEQELRFVY